MTAKSASLDPDAEESIPTFDHKNTHVRACPRIKVSKLGNLLPAKYLEVLEQNQLLLHCCRNPQNHEIEAFKSKPDEKAPDIYILHCNGCGRQHRRFCVAGGDVRPVWEVV